MKGKVRSGLFVLLLFVILPFGTIYYLNKGHQSLKEDYKELEEKGSVPAFSFVDQYGRVLTKDSLKNKVTIIDFFSTACEGDCPKMMEQFQTLQAAFEDRPDVILLSYTTNALDSSAALLKYAQQINAKKDKWFFLTGDQTALYNIAKNGYKLPVKGTAEDFTPKSTFILVDPAVNIRSYYNIEEEGTMGRLIKHITRIMPREKKKRFEYKPETEK